MGLKKLTFDIKFQCHKTIGSWLAYIRRVIDALRKLSNLPRASTTPSTHVNHEPIVQYTVLRLSNLSLIDLASTESSNDEKVFVLFCFDYVPCGASACIIIEQHANTSSSVKLSLYSLTCSPSFCHHCLVSTSCDKKKIDKIVKKKYLQWINLIFIYQQT